MLTSGLACGSIESSNEERKEKKMNWDILIICPIYLAVVYGLIRLCDWVEKKVKERKEGRKAWRKK